MKGVNFSCSSPAAAAVCTSIDRRSMVRPTIDRHRRTKPLSHNLPKPKARSSLDHRPSTGTTDLTSPANSSRYLLDESAFLDVFPEFEPDTASLDHLFERPKMYSSHSSISTYTSTPRLLKPMKENEETSTLVPSAPSTARAHHSHVWAQSLVPIDSSKLLRASKGGHKPSSAVLIRQSDSSRSHHDQGALVPIDSPKLIQSSKGDKQSSAVRRPSNSTGSHHDQVVILRVSLHCKGCEGKVRKHISKMEGVTSFNIDIASKKVTVTGDITPLGVLNSVSKVKNAQFWPSPAQASAPF